MTKDSILISYAPMFYEFNMIFMLQVIHQLQFILVHLNLFLLFVSVLVSSNQQAVFQQNSFIFVYFLDDEHIFMIQVVENYLIYQQYLSKVDKYCLKSFAHISNLYHPQHSFKLGYYPLIQASSNRFDLFLDLHFEDQFL